MGNFFAGLGQGTHAFLSRSSQAVIIALVIFVIIVILLQGLGILLNIAGVKGANIVFAILLGMAGLGLLVPYVAAVLVAVNTATSLKPFQVALTTLLVGMLLHTFLGVVPFEDNVGSYFLIVLGGMIMLFVGLIWGGGQGLKWLAIWTATTLLGLAIIGLIAGKAEHTESAEAAANYYAAVEKNADMACAGVIRAMNTDPAYEPNAREAECLQRARDRGRQESTLGRTTDRIGSVFGVREPIRTTYTLFFGSTKEVYVPEGKWEVRVVPNGPSIYHFECKDAHGIVVSNGGGDMLGSPSGVIRVQGAKHSETFINSTGGMVSVYNDSPITTYTGCQVIRPPTVTVELLPKFGVPLSGLW
jgi:hypothetical protein